MKIDYLTLFPEMFDGVLNHSIMKRAQENNKLQINTVNFRDYAINKHNQVDDYPYGGGQGMVLKPDGRLRCHRANTRYFNVSTRRAIFTSESC